LEKLVAAEFVTPQLVANSVVDQLRVALSSSFSSTGPIGADGLGSASARRDLLQRLASGPPPHDLELAVRQLLVQGLSLSPSTSKASFSAGSR